MQCFKSSHSNGRGRHLRHTLVASVESAPVALTASPQPPASLCSSEELGPALLKQKSLMQMLCSSPGLAEVVAQNSDLADVLIKTPVLVQVISSNAEVGLKTGRQEVEGNKGRGGGEGL